MYPAGSRRTLTRPFAACDATVCSNRANGLRSPTVFGTKTPKGKGGARNPKAKGSIGLCSSRKRPWVVGRMSIVPVPVHKALPVSVSTTRYWSSGARVLRVRRNSWRLRVRPATRSNTPRSSFTTRRCSPATVSCSMTSAARNSPENTASCAARIFLRTNANSSPAAD